MTHRILLTALAAAAALAAATAPAGDPDSFGGLSRRFADPPASYRTFPFLVWNDEVTEAKIDRFLNDFHAKGIGGVFIHPRPGLITPYLSDRWFELVRYTVERGKKLGMEVWLYDENSYPSGFAGGHVPAEMPESWNQGQALAIRKISGVPPATGCRVLLKKTGAAIAVAAPGDTAPGDYYCFELAYYPKRAWHGGYSYVDLLLPGVTEKFIEVTMRGYERSIGAEFGKAVPGMFTDEPNINPPERNRAFRWTPDLFEQFQKRWGYDLTPHLVSLYEPIGDWRRIRHNYYALLLQLFIDRWSKPWHAYAKAKGLPWTGHYWEHGWPSPADGPDNMAMYAWHDIPGIDMLFNQFREENNAQFGNVRAVKELASVANQMGRRRTLSETYGGAGWEITFQDQKRLADWQGVLGVNLINQHLSHMTLVGARKGDYPQSFAPHNPWWKHYRVLGDYLGRISLALATGEQVNRTLIIEPTTTAWMYAALPKHDPKIMENGNAFFSFITGIESRQGEYDLGSENIMKDHGKAAAGKLTVGQRSYDVVVLPPGTETLDTATVDLLEKYLASGGKVLAYVDAPALVNGAPSDRVARLAKSPNWNREQSIDSLLSPEFVRQDGKLLHQRRQLADGQLFFFVNSSLDAPATASLELKAATLTKMDLMTGKVSPYPATRKAGKLAFSLELPPAGSMLLFAGKTGTQPAVKPAPPAPTQPVAASGALEVRRTEPNALRLDYCDLKLAGTETKDLFFYKAAERVWKHHGLEANPWDAAVQYKTTLVDKRFPADSGFEATFWFETDASLDRTGLQLVVERPELWKVAVNGKPVTPKPGAWWLDHDFAVYAIGGVAVAGRNSVTLTAAPMTIHTELEPVYVIGDFGVSPQAKGFRLVPAKPLTTGPWKEQLLPFYPSEVAYARTYQLKRAAGPYKVRLGKWQGTVAQVKVNGEAAGVIGWQPYELDITNLVRDGENRIEVLVCGSNKNLLGPHHGQINRGLTGPGNFRRGPDGTPAGTSYDQEAYGLMEEFTLLGK